MDRISMNRQGNDQRSRKKVNLYSIYDHMKKFQELAFTITILISIGSLLVDIFCAYHLLTDVTYNPLYKELLLLNLKTLLVSFAVLIIGSLIAASQQESTPVKRNRFSRRMLDRS
jgi:hypothetical protein